MQLYTYKLLIFFILLFAANPCLAEETLAPSLSAEEAYAHWAKGNPPVFVDVREKWEWNEGHIQRAVHIPTWKIQSVALDRLNPDEHVIVYCRTDNRSQEAAKELRRLGFKKVQYLRGGIRPWKSKNYPMEYPTVLSTLSKPQMGDHIKQDS